MGSKRKNFPLTKKELNALFRDPLLIDSIVHVVSLAFSERTSPDCNQGARDFARLWLDSLAREQLWLLLLVLKGAARSRKLKPGEVKKLLMADRLGFPVSLDAPEHDGSDRARVDTLAEQGDATCRAIREYNCVSLRKAIWDRAAQVGLSQDECRLLRILLERDWDIHDVIREGFSVKKIGKNGAPIEKRLPNQKVWIMYRQVLRKLRCWELQEFYESLEEDNNV